MDSTFFSLFFLAGLVAVIFFFLTGALVGLSLFAAPSGKEKLMRAQSVALTLVTVFMLWLGWTLWGDIQLLHGAVEPSKTLLAEWARELMSMVLLGIAVVFGSLITCFGWVRAGFAGNGIRSVVWALIGVRITISSLTLVNLVSNASGEGDQMIPNGELASVANPILENVQGDMASWAWIVVTVFTLSVVASVFFRKN